MTEDTGWPPAEPDDSQAAEQSPAAEAPSDSAAGDAPPPEPPAPDWLTEVRNNAPAYLVDAIEALFHLVK